MVQEKLLRVIEYGEFERVGGSRSVKVDVRLVAATNEDLPALADSGEFRADLLDRLAFDVITLPPLRERRDDIMMLAENFAINMARELEMELFSGFTEKAKRILLDYEWPGNIRELKNVVERAVYRSNNPNLPVHNIVLDPFESIYRPQKRIKTKDRITQSEAVTSPVTSVETLSKEQAITQPKTHSFYDFPVDLKELSQDFEIDLINQALAESQFNQKKTAERLGLTYHQLRGYLKKYNLLEQTNEDID
jgi:psp operon transcriptional activator